MDLEILRALETWGALGLGQIEGVYRSNQGDDKGKLDRLFFNEGFDYRGKFYLRLRRLERWGLVQIQRAIHARQVYLLTLSGHGILRRHLPTKLRGVPRSVSPTTLEHRVLSAGVGLVASKFLGLTVLSERQFYHRLITNLGGKRPVGFHLPDLLIETADRRLPVEVELHKKDDAAYERLWSFYRSGLKPNDLVLYLTPDRKLSAQLRELAGLKRARFVFACDLNAFRASLGRSVFENCAGEAFHL